MWLKWEYRRYIERKREEKQLSIDSLHKKQDYFPNSFAQKNRRYYTDNIN